MPWIIFHGSVEWECSKGKFFNSSPKIYGKKPRKLKYIFILFKNILVFITAIILLRWTINDEQRIIQKLEEVQ